MKKKGFHNLLEKEVTVDINFYFGPKGSNTFQFPKT